MPDLSRAAGRRRLHAGAAGRSSRPFGASLSRAPRWQGPACIVLPPATALRPSASSAARMFCRRRPISYGSCRPSPAQGTFQASGSMPIGSTAPSVDATSIKSNLIERRAGRRSSACRRPHLRFRLLPLGLRTSLERPPANEDGIGEAPVDCARSELTAGSSPIGGERCEQRGIQLLLAGNFLRRGQRSVSESPAISWPCLICNPAVAGAEQARNRELNRSGTGRRFRSGSGKKQAGEIGAQDPARPGCKAWVRIPVLRAWKGLPREDPGGGSREGSDEGRLAICRKIILLQQNPQSSENDRHALRHHRAILKAPASTTCFLAARRREKVSTFVPVPPMKNPNK